LNPTLGQSSRAPSCPLRVRIASVGVLSAYGSGMAPLVAGIRAGLCPVLDADGIGYPAKALPQVSRFPMPAPQPGEAGAAARLLEVVEQALGESHLGEDALREEEFGLVVGTAGFLYASSAELYGRAMGTLPAATPVSVRGPSWGAALIAERYGLRGPSLTVSSGCTSSANALLIAAEMIDRGRVRRVLVVGAEELSAVTLSGFDSLMLLDPACCRPFDRDRQGIQIGEGIAAMVLEADGGADAGTGGASKFARVRGGANRCDTHHLTSANPNGSVMRDVMQEALASAGISAADVVAVKAHGAGSTDSDRAEAAALRAGFGATLPPLLALKRYVGHTLGACGTLETAALMGCVADGFLPAAAGFSVVDPELGVTPLREAVQARSGHYLLNFFGFGGNYTSLVLEIG
jgi:3-oxoacyl-[acyl-carrier-protein] synthase-1